MGRETAEGGAPIDRVLLSRLLARRRRDGLLERVVLANGCFEVLHAGHVRYLQDAASRGDVLVVAINGDAAVRALKGEGRPVAPLADRVAVVAALGCVDYVVVFDEPTLDATLRVLRPDVHAKGTDYTPADVPEGDTDAELGIEIAICGDPKTRSATELIARLGGAAALSDAHPTR